MLKYLILILFFGTISSFSQVKSLENRELISLKDWSFKKGKFYNAQKINFNDADFESVKIPHTFSMDAIENVGYYRGESWYRTKVHIPISMQNERIFIRFEAVGHEAEVFVNEKRINKHVGGYAAFCYEITNEININQENLIAVMVSNEPNFKRIPVNDKLFNHYGGIYRPVQIFSTPKLAISPIIHASSGVFLEQKEVTRNKGILEIRTHISNKSEASKALLNINIKNNLGENVATKSEEIELNSTEKIIASNIAISNPILWNGRENPHLYSVEITLISENEKDVVTQNFGFRTFSFDANKGFILNDKPYKLYGVNMHEDWKNTGPALTKKQHIEDFNYVDELGITTLRTAHYQHSNIVYELANEKGILVWTEIPFVHDYSGRENENATQQLTELILQNYNHPSVFVWGIWNEVRANKSPDEPCVLLTKELVKLAKTLDPSRPTISASDKNMTSNMGNITDLQAWNKYFGWYYGTYNDMGTWLDTSHKNFPERPLAISEYGIGGNVFHQDASKLEKPVGDYFPEMEQTNYHEITWKIFKDRPYVWGTYVWCMFDFSVNVWNRGGIPSLNHKGLMTYDRNIKKDAFYFYKANWNPEPMVYIAERRNHQRTEAITFVKVYTNCKSVILYLNNKKISEEKQTSEINIITFENIELKKGKNTIKIVSKDNKLKDEVIWNLN